MFLPIMFRDYSIYTLLLAILLAGFLSGCGTTKSRSATEQLLVSDAIDRSIASINFQPLAGRRVYLDTKYLKTIKGSGFANADYIISSLRQQMLASNCYLEEKATDAEYVVEVRVGALGTDAHDVVYGIPPSSTVSTAASLVPSAPAIPIIPEISLIKKADEVAAAKIAVFAYHRETGQAVWQSGIAEARSSSKDMWVFGAGPFQSGTIHDRTRFAGEDLEIPLIAHGSKDRSLDRLQLYEKGFTFVQPPSETESDSVQQASHEEKADKNPKANPPAKPAKPAPEKRPKS